MAVEVKPTVGAHVGGYAHVDVNARECKTGNPENSHRFCNETCKETNLASLDAFSFQKSVFGSDFLEHVDDVSPKSNTSL
ncbi:hypothetical protein YC2023_099351 [Brassica napus]